MPVGVEAYGAYALRAWLAPGTSEMARMSARWSAIGSLALGMLGQVAYHLLSAAQATRAPWPVGVLASSLPVVRLGLSAALTHTYCATQWPIACPTVYLSPRSTTTPRQCRRTHPTPYLPPCPRWRPRQWLGVLDVGRLTGTPRRLSGSTRPTWQRVGCRVSGP
jgi:hypothetical protein